MSNGQKIIDGLRDAVNGDFKRVNIEGQTWVRLDKGDRVVNVPPHHTIMITADPNNPPPSMSTLERTKVR